MQRKYGTRSTGSTHPRREGTHSSNDVSPALAAELNDCFMAGGTFEEIKQCALDGVASLPGEGMDSTSDASVLGVASLALPFIAAALF